jgi:diguanylate cyclase (GGDEF)-like protein/PAS domain S-box-containing protein
MADRRSMMRRAWLSYLLGGCVLLALWGIVPALDLGPISNLAIAASTMALFILLAARMSGLVRRLELSLLRERALRSAGASLVTATNRQGIYNATIEAARTLVGDGAVVRLFVNLESNAAGDLTAVAASEGDAGTLGAVLALSQLPRQAQAQLVAQDKVHMRASEIEVGPRLGIPGNAQSVLAVPLFMKGELGALLVVASPSPIPGSTTDGLEALCLQVALALDSAALTEDLLRRQSEARFASLVQNSSDLIIVVDADSTIRYVSPSVERVLGYVSGELEGTKLTALIHPEDKTQILQLLTSADRDDGAQSEAIEFRLHHRDDRWLEVETLRTNLLQDPNVRGIVLNTRDISERKAFEEQLQHQSLHDSITNLANRALFKDRVEHALERQARDDKPVTILFMDLDDFKTVNDSLGHAAGDLMLAQVGDRLRNCLRAADTAARLGGDEFAILLENVGQGVEPGEVAARILAALEGPFHLEGKEVFIRASIGIATAPFGSETRPKDSEELLRNADVAMYMAKEAGKGRYQVFEPAMHNTALRRLELKADLQRATDHGEFVLHYQPVIELETGGICGLEALLRWNHPQRGLIPPLEFIPLAEETGLIVPIGNWVMREACRQAVLLHERFGTDPPLHMAVNLSARQLQRPEIVAEVAEILMDSGLEPGTLILEITESVMMRDVDLTIQRLTELKELGVKLAVDDFGTGYSSLNYIRRFPVDILKVDKSFVEGVNKGGEESALTAAIIELAAILKLRPVAEGIERADQLERLLDLHCDLGQGFYFARPLPMDGIDELLVTRTTLERRESELSS